MHGVVGRSVTMRCFSLLSHPSQCNNKTRDIRLIPSLRYRNGHSLESNCVLYCTIGM